MENNLTERMKKYAELNVRYAILHELAGFRLTNQVELEDENTGLSLVDALFCGDDVSTGYEELERLADNIADLFDDKLQAAMRALEAARDTLILYATLDAKAEKLLTGEFESPAEKALKTIDEILGKS